MQQFLLYLSYKGQICQEREEKNRKTNLMHSFMVIILQFPLIFLSCELLDSDSPAAPHTNYTNIAVQILPELDYAHSCL